MKRRKNYSEIILEIVREADSVCSAYYNSRGGMTVISCTGVEFNSELYDGSVMLHSIHGVTRMESTIEEIQQAQEAIAAVDDQAVLYANPIVERDGRVVRSLMVTLSCRWMGLKEFKRTVDGLCAKMAQCDEVLKSHFADVVYRKIDVDAKATHKLLMNGE